MFDSGYMRYALKTALLFGLLVFGAVTSPLRAGAVQQIETRYFTIVFDDDGDYTAGRIAQFCDEIYEDLMGRYDAFSDNPRVVCLVNDAADVANGYAIYYQNTITIYATNLDYELRGQSSWLRNVFVHEMTHMIALKKAAHGPVNFIGVGGGKYDHNPDLDVSLVWYHLSQPAWFSEGTAQVGAESFGAEHWDTHRDMLLRSAWHAGALLSMDDMSVLSGQNGLESELVYNQGYSLARFIKERYGYDKLVELNNRTGYFDFSPTIRAVLGVSPAKLYDDWTASLDTVYAPFTKKTPVEGTVAANEGSTDYFPAVSPDGRWLAWLSSRGRDYAIMDLMLKDRETGKVRTLVKEVENSVSWSHDSSTLVFTKRPPRRPNFYDLYTVDVETGTERRISRQMRARDPSFSPGDSLVVFVRSEGGNTSLGLIRADGAGYRSLTTSHDGTQFYRPSFSPDGSRILFGIYRQDLDRDIAVIDADSPAWRHPWDVADSTSAFSDSTTFGDGADFRILVGSSADERDARFLPDGGIVYSSDRTGVFNLYRIDAATGRAVQLTDVVGGAFCPSPAPDGEVVYAGFSHAGFSIFTTSLATEVDTATLTVEDRDYTAQPPVFDLSKNFAIKPATSKRIVNGIVPVVNYGPSFIGSKFGLKVLDIGAEAYIADLLGYDSLIMSGTIGRNVKEDVPLNNSMQVYYQRRLTPVTSSTYSHSPTMYMGVSRSVINNLVDRFSGEADSVYMGDYSSIGYPEVLSAVHQKLDIADRYQHEFRSAQAGVQIPLARRQSLNLQADFHRFSETLKRRQEIHDLSTFIADGVDITQEIPGARQTYRSDTRYFTDMEYYRSNEFSIGYSYLDIESTADADISPIGTAALFRYKYINATYADSLVNQVALLVPYGLYTDGYFAMESYVPDELLDELRPYQQQIDVNEWIMLAQHNRRLPYLRHALNGLVFVGYRDVALKDWRKNEGSGYNWPLKFYLGGEGMLSGYPYFAFWGSKMFYSRFDYVFPIRGKIARTFMGLHVQRLFGDAFFEAGSVWNFEKMSADRIREADLKRDVGFELRLKMIGFYRFPMMLTAKVAWPLDDIEYPEYAGNRDARRFYIGLRM